MRCQETSTGCGPVKLGLPLSHCPDPPGLAAAETSMPRTPRRMQESGSLREWECLSYGRDTRVKMPLGRVSTNDAKDMFKQLDFLILVMARSTTQRPTEKERERTTAR